MPFSCQQWGLQICPSSVEFTSVRNMNTRVIKKVWIVNEMKWTLPKNKGDPQKDTSETTNSLRLIDKHKGSNPKRKGCHKMSLKPHWGSGLPLRHLPKVTRRSMSKMSNGRTTLEYKKEMCPKETVLRKLYENAKCKVPNSMIEIYVMDSKNHVMCNGRGSLEEQWWIGDKHQITRWGERL